MYNFSIKLDNNVEQIIKKYCKVLKDNNFTYYYSSYNRQLGQAKIKGITYNFKRKSINITIDKDLISNMVYVGCYDNKSFRKLPLASFEDILNYI